MLVSVSFDIPFLIEIKDKNYFSLDLEVVVRFVCLSKIFEQNVDFCMFYCNKRALKGTSLNFTTALCCELTVLRLSRWNRTTEEIHMTQYTHKTLYLALAEYSDTGPTSLRANVIVPDTWQASHWISKSLIQLHLREDSAESGT